MRKWAVSEAVRKYLSWRARVELSCDGLESTAVECESEALVVGCWRGAHTHVYPERERDMENERGGDRERERDDEQDKFRLADVTSLAAHCSIHR